MAGTGHGLRVRTVNAGYILDELGKVLANRGNRLAGKWCLTSESRYENRDARRNGNKRLQRQWYGMLKENALLGNFQHAPQTHYKCLPMKPKCLWCVVKIWRLRKQFSSACNTAVRGDGTEYTARPCIEWRNVVNPETLCTIFLQPLKGWRGIVGFRLED